MRMLLNVVALATALSAQGTHELSVLASGAVEGSMVALKGTVPPAAFRFETSQGIATRLAGGEIPDVLIAQAAIVDQLVADRKAIADTRISLGRMPIGVAIGPNGTRPDLSSANALKAAVLGADVIMISRGASGAFLEKAFRDLGIADQIESKLRRESRGDDVMKGLGESRGNAIGFTMVSEIKYGERHGGRSIGLLPSAIQNYTPYDAIVLTASRDVDAARAFVRALALPASRAVLQKNGWER
jgi:molybdate transport system substrate-binding protein